MDAEHPSRFLAAARTELIVAATRYEHEREGLGDDFLRNVDRAVAAIVVAPRRWPLARGVAARRNARRYVLHRLPFNILYRLLADDVVEVVAIAHHKRRPGYRARR